MFNTRGFVIFLITLVLIIAALSALAYFLPFTIFSKINDASAAILQARSRMQYLDEASAASKLNEKKLSHESDTLSKIDAMFLDKNNPLLFIETIETLAESSNVSLAIDALQDNSSVPPMFRLTLLGRKDALLDFLFKLENGPTFVAVREFSLDNLSIDELQNIMKAKEIKSPLDSKMVLLVEGLAK